MWSQHHGPDVKVRDVMAKDVKTLRETDTVRAAARQLAEHRIGGMPVVDGSGTLVGILTELDVLEALKTQHKKLRMLMPPEISFGISFVQVMEEREATLAFEEIGDRPVSGIMTTDVAAVAPDDAIEHAIQLMVQRKVHRLPVAEGGKVVGILTRGDVLRGFFRSLVE